MTIEELEQEISLIKEEWEEMKLKFFALQKSYDKLNKSYTISVYEFFNKFTNEEFGMILAKMEDDINLKILYNKLMIAQEVTLTEKDTIDGLNYLVLVGILTEQRKEEILVP